uniref:E2F/DP family winged-helix DNA-binding domain-containing protein n=1 Tax=Eptatretus burgeri TaxID=7764 RepID=A0A8C4PVV6_EPTBU
MPAPAMCTMPCDDGLAGQCAVLASTPSETHLHALSWKVSEHFDEEEKENFPRRSLRGLAKTPLKQVLPYGAGQTQTTPIKAVEAPAEPLTPTANLKMLISAASPDMRDREHKKKELFRSPVNNLEEDDDEEDEYEEDVQEYAECEDLEKHSGSRKEKSLGLLCLKFLARFPDFPEPGRVHPISLDEITVELNVERRRIYDIVNVLESLHMVKRTAKNRYAWYGRCQLRNTLAALHKDAHEQGYARQMELLESLAISKSGYPEKVLIERTGTLKCENENVLSALRSKSAPGTTHSRKEKSLRVLSQKFVMLFLVAESGVVSLDMAAKVLLGESQQEAQNLNKFKTKVRRLYDIANVLSSLGLIRKVRVLEVRGRKPAFKWISPDQLPETSEVHYACTDVGEDLQKIRRQSTRRSFTRRASLRGMECVAVPEGRKISSAPCSPSKCTPVTCGLDSFSSKMDQLAAICKLQLERQNRLVKGTAVEANKAALDKPSTGGKLTPKIIGIQHAHCSLYSSKMQAKEGTSKLKVSNGSCPSSFAPSQVLFLQQGKRRDICSDEPRGHKQAKQDGCPGHGQPCTEVPRCVPLSSAGLPPDLPALSQPVQPNSVQSSLPLLLSKQFICLSPPAGSHTMALSPVAIHQLQPLSLSKTFPLSVVTPIYPGQVVTLQRASVGSRPLAQEQVSNLSSSSPSQPGQPLTFISFQQKFPSTPRNRQPVVTDQVFHTPTSLILNLSPSPGCPKQSTAVRREVVVPPQRRLDLGQDC